MRHDPAHVATDKEIEKIEKQIAKEYRQAHKEVSEKLKDYLSRFEKKDAKWQEWVKDGKVTEKEYIAWRRGQMLVGKRWEGLCETLAEDYTNAAKIAMSITKEHAPEVYAVNHNYSTFEVEKSTGLDTSYTLYSRETIERMYREDPKLYHNYGKAVEKEIREGKQKPWDKRRVKSVLTQAVLQGESIPKITKRLEIVTGGDHKAAIRNARTIMTGVQNAGRIDAMKRANDLGIPTKKQWLATVDGRTRHWHRELDGVIKDIDEPFENEFGKVMFPADPDADGANVYNCFIGETKVASDSEIVRSYKHEYTGNLITIETAGGVKFTCTPNHPILTPRGWVGAERLERGDNILVANIGENNSLWIDPNVNHAFSRFDAIHELFDKTRGERTRSLSVNFHGDIPTTDVEIITKKRFLGYNANTRIGDGVNKFLLIHPNKSLMGKSAFMKHFAAITHSAFSFMSCCYKTLALIFRSMSHAVVHRLRTIAGRDSVVFESQTNDVPCHAELISNGLNGATTIVLMDNIVNIKISSVRHIPVYNLQTVNGYYFVNNIIPQGEEKYNCKGAIAHNCRCTLLSAIKGFELDVTDPSVRPMPKLKDMTYGEWKKAKKTENVASQATKGKIARNYNNPIAKAVGKDRYDGICDALDASNDTDAKALYMKHIDDVGVLDSKARGGAYCQFTSINWNAEKDSADTNLRKAYSVFYHESGHAIDHLLANEKGVGWFYSTAWNNGEFSKTIKDEVGAWVDDIKKNLKEGLKKHASDIEWLKSSELLGDYSLRQLQWYADKNGVSVEDVLSKKIKIADANRFIPKVTNKNAYSVIEKEIQDMMQTEHGNWKVSDISDILEGATKGNIQCGWGHGKSYWKRQDVAVEAFAEMMQAHVVGDESLEVLEKYLPKSVDAFRRMCKDAVK